MNMVLFMLEENTTYILWIEEQSI